ncbi:MAG: energy transducer TonB [Alphaproteobacteria bacterium]
MGRSAAALAVLASVLAHGALAAGLVLLRPAPASTPMPESGAIHLVMVSVVDGSAAAGAPVPATAAAVSTTAPDGAAARLAGAPTMTSAAMSVATDATPDVLPDMTAQSAPAVAEARVVAPDLLRRPTETPVAQAAAASSDATGRQMAALAPAAGGTAETAGTVEALTTSATAGDEPSSASRGDGVPAPAAGNPRPDYPWSARRNGIEGRVVLRVEVLPSGMVGQVVVAESSGYGILDRAAQRTVALWRYDPPRGRVTTRVPVVFRLEN